MKLKKLIATGFKSFADRTEFEFDDGISCIVGPNGCGKSNVVDAIKWVLGEQSAKSLRGSEMMDVIFNGSSARRPSGHAEVSLVFDNTSGMLKPLGAEEDSSNTTVSVTRRLYRSGQSEYLINKQPARLRDIREMFLDTGVGVHAYGVIEQGHVEVFLQASHEERRAIFDEASGISRYKARKKEALRKLERVEQNLLRLQDVLGEVERRLRSIKYQAGKARNYQAYAEQLKGLKSLHYLSQYHRLSKQREQLQHDLDQSSDALASVHSRVEQLNAALTASEAESEDLERSARDLRVQIATIGGQITTWQERAEAHERRVKEFGERMVALASRCEELEAKIASIEQELTGRKSEAEALDANVAELAERYDKLREAHQAGEVEIGRLRGDLEDEKNGTMDLIRRAAQLHNEVQNFSLRKDSLSGQHERLTGRAAEVEKAIEQCLVERASLETKLADVEETLAATKARLEEAQQSSRDAAEGEHRLRADLAAAREERSALDSRARALQEMQQRLEGVQSGVRRVLKARREGKLGWIRGMLGEFLQADVEHAPIIEAALGGADQHLIADDFDTLNASRGELVEVLGDRAGAEVWCLDSVGRWRDDFDAGACDGVIARAIDWVRFDAPVARAVWSVLGRTLVVESLEDARALAKRVPEGYRFVTGAGEVLEADGRLRLGCATRAAGVVTRRSELADLRRKLNALAEKISRLEDGCQAARGQREHLETVVQGLRTAIYEDSMEQTSCRSRLAQVDDQIAELKREQPVIADDLRHLAEEIDAAVRRGHEASEKAKQLEELRAEREEHTRVLEQRLAEAQARRDEQAGEMTDVKVALGQAREKAAALREAVSSLERQREQMSADLESARGEKESARQGRSEAGAAIEKARAEIDALYQRHETLSREGEDLEETQRGLREKVGEIRSALSEQNRAAEAAGEKVNACRVSISQADTNIANLITRASEDMSMDLLEEFTRYEHDEERDWDAVAAEIRDLDGKIKRLGNVNLDAIAEQEELEARQALYAGQVEDIEKSRRQLDELIRRINHESRQLFEDTFEAARENFQGLFRKLFGGGRADILLTDPQDVLESGIDIVARPPGKELRSISLLSGGEKTMTALALLFSIFKCKPSPFCLLDEVDAALDEANTERFARLIQEFVESSQFLIISHAKRTMSMANVLYGVTMQEPGVSKRISVRFEDAEKHLKRDREPEPVGV